MRQLIQEDILIGLWRVLDAEFKKYSYSGSILKGRSQAELKDFSNEVFFKKITDHCPFWNLCIKGAAGVSLDGICTPKTAINSMPLQYICQHAVT